MKPREAWYRRFARAVVATVAGVVGLDAAPPPPTPPIPGSRRARRAERAATRRRYAARLHATWTGVQAPTRPAHRRTLRAVARRRAFASAAARALRGAS